MGRGAAVPTGTELPATRSGSGGRSRGRVAAQPPPQQQKPHGAKTPELAGQRWACVPGGGGADNEPEGQRHAGVGRKVQAEALERRQKGVRLPSPGSGRADAGFGARSPSLLFSRGLLPFPGT